MTQMEDGWRPNNVEGLSLMFLAPHLYLLVQKSGKWDSCPTLGKWAPDIVLEGV